MNQILYIEIKDNLSIITLANLINGKWFILLNKNYFFEKNNLNIQVNDEFNYDLSWIPRMKLDIEEIIFFDKIDNIFLSVNNSLSIIKTEKISIKNSVDINDILNDSKKKLIQKYKNKNLIILNLTLDLIEKTPIRKKYYFSYELINQKFWIGIENYFKSFNINITKKISVKQSLKNALDVYLIEDKKVFSIQIEDNFLFINLIENNNFLLTVKHIYGLNHIYKKISTKFNISLDEAKNIFMKFGSLPLEKIIDNRIIFSNKNENNQLFFFSKNQLSSIIKIGLNDIFHLINYELQNYNDVKDLEIIFSGEINKLDGFQNYCNEKITNGRITIFSDWIFGLQSNYEIITIGVLYWWEKRISKVQFDLLNNKKSNYKTKNNKFKFKKYLINKINKYYKYI